MNIELPQFIGQKRVIEKPKDFPKKIINGNEVFYTGDTLVFAINEQGYFTFGLKIKSIK